MISSRQFMQNAAVLAEAMDKAAFLQPAARAEGRALAAECSLLLEIERRSQELARKLEEDRLRLEGMLYRVREGRGVLGEHSLRLLQHRNEARAIAALAHPKGDQP